MTHRDPAGLPARRAAWTILRAVDDGVPFDQALDRGLEPLADADRRLAHELAAGVLRRRTDLDARLQPLVHRGWASVPADLRDVLRLGAYQLTALDRVPLHAAVSTTVDLARAVLGEKAAKFANAILRGVGGRAAPPSDDADPAVRLASVHSHPVWLVRRWLARFGDAETEALLAWDNQRPPLTLQPARATLDDLQRALWSGGVGARRAPCDAGLVVEGVRPAELPGFTDGGFMVQDAAQALVARFVACPAGATVYDACAAPGGKTIAVAHQAGRVLAGELRLARARRLAENLARAGSGREFVVVASAAAPPCRPVDVVLLDAPCLGTGTLARHPDARWRVGPDALERLAREQERLLESVAAVVRPGGWLVYASCSLEPEENEEQVHRFLSRHPDFHRDPAPMPDGLLTPSGDLQLLPQRHGTDGAFAARLRKRA
ncbi:MAG: 16S rRNA (cytosine(967)-C(5))-methyltransferase RsmB [Gemmatimonadetes bacterium]|nr:16S rRNA (cytosine(967)-C(5))-methyltransferase RsmB [Gemmatimonadota bacterium]MBK7349779.1 16S rRNA (cytosine(967)-C(5))-methyltransferase RsmB [Gemmatimonadota bacterium]MBK7784409.1 16S rRNA (cytosine(967)-C(5))-methyltransferase RsmB [Gemmatimonadota bacterium]MBK7925347.1 16S rRNA (cytosine(967)-C(5))-methyltransferase RsmB [Gemmatimonadota bacterium]MBK9067546.1 16S rRNA (cytosine(967)-C(5))-methyltransferase RsmB [Gemmatimonadota bacterium]